MCSFISFLNENSGAFTVLLTVVLAIINVCQWRLAHKLRKDANRPKVLADVVGISTIIHYKLVNFGTTSAVNIKVRIDQALKNRMQVADPLRQQLEKIETGTFALLPNEAIYITTHTMWNKVKNEKICISYTYADIAGNKYSESQTFDLSILDLVSHQDHYERENRNLRKSVSDSIKP